MTHIVYIKQNCTHDILKALSYISRRNFIKWVKKEMKRDEYVFDGRADDDIVTMYWDERDRHEIAVHQLIQDLHEDPTDHLVEAVVKYFKSL